MKMEFLNQLPYTTIEELVNMRNFFRVKVSNNLGLIKEKVIDNNSPLFHFSDFIREYAFVVRSVQYDKQSKKTNYHVFLRPAGLQRIEGNTYLLEYDGVKDFFDKWISNIIALNKIKHEFLNPDQQFYDEQFSEFFTNDDEDAAENPFELERQELLYYFLQYSEKAISTEESISDEAKMSLLNYVSQLKEEIPKSTKKKIVFDLSKLAQKIKGTSNKLFHDVFDVLKKEGIKKILYWSASKIPEISTDINHWIHLLNP